MNCFVSPLLFAVKNHQQYSIDTIMNKFYLLCFFLTLLCTSVRAQEETPVTVRVDMSAEVVTGDVLFVGSWPGFNLASGIPMVETTPGSAIYELTFNRPIGDNIEYKIVNSGTYETPSADCVYQHNTNRVLTVAADPVTIPTFPFNGCPAGVQLKPVKFFVDVAGQDISNGVYLVGEMVGWNNPNNTQMSQVGNSTVYEATVNLPTEDLLRINYKYFLGPNYANAETSTPAPCANPSNSDRFYEFTGGVEETEVYFFNTCDVSLALPVELTRFEATQAGKTVLIDWGTAAEEDVDFFLVERSTTGTNFTLLQEVSARSAGRSSNAYGVTDEQPVSGINYYRLTTIDLDGTRHIEGVRTVNFNGSTDEAPLLFPNPVNDQLTVSFRGAATISVIDALGRQVHQAVATDGFNWADAGRLVPGQYYLRLETKAGLSQVAFIKQ